MPTLVPVETLPAACDVVLDEPTWSARRASHEARVDAWVQPHLARRAAGVAHPVEDFLFGYYAQRPAALRRWHPGFGTGLADGASYAGLKGYGVGAGVAAVTREHRASQRVLLTTLHRLLRGITGASSRTAARSSSVSVSWTPTYNGSPARATIFASSEGMPSSSTSPVITPYWGSSPVVNLAIRTP